MTKLLSILTLVLLIVLFPPSVLALISNNAVPGDVTYPVKRKLEDGILLIVSINPATRAWFWANRSTRRFDEAKILIAQGKSQAGESLNELVTQTDIAAKEIEKVQDPVQKEQLKQQMIASIEQYNQGLSQIQEKIIPQEEFTSTPASKESIQPTQKPSTGTEVSSAPPETAKPASRPSLKPTSVPTSLPTQVPTSVLVTPSPREIPAVSATPTSTIVSQSESTVSNEQIDKVKDQLEKIKADLKKEEKENQEKGKDDNKKTDRKENGNPNANRILEKSNKTNDR